MANLCPIYDVYSLRFPPAQLFRFMNTVIANMFFRGGIAICIM